MFGCRTAKGFWSAYSGVCVMGCFSLKKEKEKRTLSFVYHHPIQALPICNYRSAWVTVIPLYLYCKV